MTHNINKIIAVYVIIYRMRAQSIHYGGQRHGPKLVQVRASS